MLFHELWQLEWIQLAKVTFKVTQRHYLKRSRDSEHIPLGSNMSCTLSCSSVSISTRNLKYLALPTLITLIWFYFYFLLGGCKCWLALFVLFRCSFQLLCFTVSMEQIKIDRNLCRWFRGVAVLSAYVTENTNVRMWIGKRRRAWCATETERVSRGPWTRSDIEPQSTSYWRVLRTAETSNLHARIYSDIRGFRNYIWLEGKL